MHAELWLCLLSAAAVAGAGYLGEKCYYDVDCETETTFCRGRSRCDCKDNYRNDNGRCIATVGARCSSPYDCNTLPYSECVDEVCTCAKGYVVDSEHFSCLPAVGSIFQECKVNEQCEATFGFYSQCQNNKCECKPSFHFADGACFRSIGLGERCSNSSECSYNEKERNKLHCLDSTCKCRDGFRRSDNVCVDGASQIMVSIPILLLYWVIQHTTTI